IRPNGLGERRPTGTRLELLARREQRIAATRAYVSAGVLGLQKATAARRLGAVLPEHAILFGGQPRAPFLVAKMQPLHHLIVPPTFASSLHMRPDESFPSARIPL